MSRNDRSRRRSRRDRRRTRREGLDGAIVPDLSSQREPVPYVGDFPPPTRTRTVEEWARENAYPEPGGAER